jgi:hypothetical protein
VKGGKKRKSKGIEGSARENDVWVWMRPHIRFCTIGKCDLLSFFLFDRISPSSLQILPFFLKHGASSYEVSPLLLFNPCFFFLGSFLY